jgi:acetyl esterase
MDTIEPLQPRVRKFLEFIAANPDPPLEQATLATARVGVVLGQSAPVAVPAVSMQRRTIAGLSAYIYRPAGNTDLLPAVLYFHGGGWVLCDHQTHDRLMRELAAASGVALVFIEYSLSPEKRYPTALVEAYLATKYIADHGTELGLDGSRLAVAGDSAGANLATAVTMLAKRHKGFDIRFQLLFFPVTDAAMNTPSYEEFAERHFLTRAQMRFFWDCYAPDPALRSESTASPLRASLDELRGLPEALVITADHDVLRDEGEAYAHKLAAAGVPVTATRYPGTIHAFVVLNAFTEDPSPRRAIAQAAASLRNALAPSA